MKKDNRNQSSSGLQQRLRASSKKIKILSKRNGELEPLADKMEEVRHLALFFYAAGTPSQQRMAEEFLNLFDEGY